ncbi:response regulator [Sphingomonas sabuli]|uniref:Response regulator n=1 Tax=Sphingomonas sabuli TaxID=2764186 RepID=A0A7G9KZX2_9SPHN|nr:response regulator [Sphingomonas sabuli]QNM81921.1 response regulator [Sphingomonas sabuli]
MIAGLRILILEDEPIIGLALEAMLSDEGAKVVYAERLGEAEAVLDGGQIDAAILDVNIHGATSYGVAARLEQLAIPYIFVTGYGDLCHPPDFAAVRTISKPCSGHEIRSALVAASGASQSS